MSNTIILIFILIALAGLYILILLLAIYIYPIALKHSFIHEGPILKFLIINSIKIKGGQNMNITMNPSQDAIGAVEFKNRRGGSAEIQPGTARYEVREVSTGEIVPAEEATVSPTAENEKHFRVVTGTTAPATRKLWEVWAFGDGDKDEDEERIVSGPVLAIVFEALEAEGVSSASVIQQPTDLPA